MKQVYNRLNILQKTSINRTPSFERKVGNLTTFELKNTVDSKLQEISQSFFFQILTLLKKEGYIRYFVINIKGRSVFVTVYVKYSPQGNSRIRSIKNITTPGRAVHTSVNALWQPLSTTGLVVLSTPLGILSDREARKYCVGGKILFSIILMQSLQLPFDINIEISNKIQETFFLKRKGPLGTFIKKRGNVKLSILEKNQTKEGPRIFISGVSPKHEAIVLAQIWKQAFGLSLGYRKRLRLTGIGFRGAFQKTSLQPIQNLTKQNVIAKARMYPKYRKRNFVKYLQDHDNKGQEKQKNQTSYINNKDKNVTTDVLQLKLGFSHDSGYPLFRAQHNKIKVDVSRPEGRTKGTVVVLEGSESPTVSEIAVHIQNLRKPDIYKGKGMHFDGKVLKLKKGKRQG